MPEPDAGSEAVAAAIHRCGRATIGDAIRRQALRQGDKIAIVDPEQERAVSYRELNELGDAFANALLSLGVRTGEGVAALASTRLEYAIAYVGALKIGAPFTGLNTRAIRSDIEWQLENAGSVVLIADRAHGELATSLRPTAGTPRHRVLMNGALGDPRWHGLEELLEKHAGSPDPVSDVTEDSIALLSYTSGTEARPKGVLLSHRNYLIGTMPSLLIDRYIDAVAVELLVKPLFTIAGLGSLTSHLLVGSTVVLLPQASPDGVLRAVARYRVNTLGQTPTFYVALTQSEAFASADLSSIRQCHTYGGVISRSALERFRAVAPDVLWASYWGQSELTQLGTIGWFREFADIPEGDVRWIGRPTAGLEVRVVDEDGVPNETGELICRSPALMQGYHRAPELTAAAIRDGWLRTRDIVRVGPHGDLFFLDRQKDTIKSGGFNISSAEIESVLLQHPLVLDAAVVGLRDEYWSEAVSAFIVPRNGTAIDADEIRAFCRERLAAYKVPKRVFFESDLPRDGQGKVQKRALRDRAPVG